MLCGIEGRLQALPCHSQRADTGQSTRVPLLVQRRQSAQEMITATSPHGTYATRTYEADGLQLDAAVEGHVYEEFLVVLVAAPSV